VFTELLAPNDIAINVAVTSKRALFEHVGALIESHHGLPARTVIDSLTERERYGSTGIGEGIAIPHGRLRGLERAIGVFVRPANPMAFDGPDGKAVDQIFTLLVPESATDHHLLILSELSIRFSEKTFRDALRACATPQAVLALFCAP
jgi:nitrogen PTS system EIIA component